MEDLREVGKKVIAAVGDLGASNAGDLVLGIGQLIEELRDQPDAFQEKLDHLEGLFKEFAYGEGYHLRNDRTKEEEEPEYEYASGVLTRPQSFNLPVGALSGTLNSIPMPACKPPIKTPRSATTNPPVSIAAEPIPVIPSPVPVPVLKKKKPRVFTPAWWKKKV